MANHESVFSSVTEIPFVNRVASVFVHVTDLRRSAEWYSRLLGLPMMEERMNGGPVYWFDFEGTHLILDSNRVNRQNLDWDEGMMPRIMFEAKSIDDAYRYIQEKGEPLLELERHGTMAFFNFRDPEGNTHMACWSEQGDADALITGQSPILPRVGGVFVDVKNIREAARWYSDLLGVPFDEDVAAQHIYSVPVISGASLLLDQNRYLNQESFTEVFYFETEDFEAALAFVRSEGFELAGEPSYFPDLSEFTLLDPDGNRIVIAKMNERGK
ncbi:VOC family protein [Paenibacillus sp. D2_2]|uniref:VOC family protein n=1 Tax=Paenibacillus sp. D2_2 TaxID=3073092 RepID=UPI002814B088|nr:VOC family protein [Paenibacillus sp. D2_2]WMT43328.1 VOC family protein [Paenibacillus sp. D2_2]